MGWGSQETKYVSVDSEFNGGRLRAPRLPPARSRPLPGRVGARDGHGSLIHCPFDVVRQAVRLAESPDAAPCLLDRDRVFLPKTGGLVAVDELEPADLRFVAEAGVVRGSPDSGSWCSTLRL